MTIRRYLVAPPAGGGGGEGGAVDSVNDQTGVVVLDAADVGAQPADTDLTAIAGLTHADNTVLQTVSGAWAARTPAQVKTTLALAKADVGLGSVDNVSAASLRDRTTHTGAQAISTVTGLQTALDGKTALSVDGAFTATYDIDTTPITPGDIGAQPAGDYVTSSTVTAIVTLTQAAYDALTPASDTVYIVTD